MINLFKVVPRRFNVGNAIIQLATARMLRDAFEEPVNLVPLGAIAADSEAWLSGLTARSVHEMNLYGHGVIVGGGNLYENGQLDVEVNALERLAPPLLLWSLSYGRIYDRRGRLTRRTDSMPDELIAALNRAATASLARDDATLSHLRSLGLSAVGLGGCPTLFLDELVPITAWPSDESSGTLVSIRNPRLMSIPHSRQIQIHGDVHRITEALAEEGLGPVRLLCHDTRDLEFASTFPAVEYLFADDAFSYLDLLRRAQLVVSFRLHAFVPCLSYATPTVNISYDERSLSFVHTLGLGDWDINLITEADLAATVLDRVRRLPALTELVTDSRPLWDEQRATMHATLAQFGEQVRAYAAEPTPAAS